MHTSPLASKLPAVGTTIFTVMSRLAAEHGAINLSQGFPDFEPPARLVELVAHHMHRGANQYAPMPGHPALRAAIAAKVLEYYGRNVDAERDITVTSGGTEALFAAIHAVVRSGDEVVVLDPAYDSYEPAVTLAGGKVRHVPLRRPDFSVDWQAVRDAISAHTRLLIVNAAQPQRRGLQRRRPPADGLAAARLQSARSRRRGLRAHAVRRAPTSQSPDRS